MPIPYQRQILGEVNKNLNTTRAKLKGCYVPKCTERPIRSHSISKRRVLEKICENGKVICLGNDYLINGNTIEVGISQASTLKCFCKKHDQKIFAPIDNFDYEVGNKEQEFLFAFRTAARELLSKRVAVEVLSKREENDDILKIYNEGQKLSVNDQEEIKRVLIDTLIKKKYNVINTATFIIDEEIPIAASASFNLEVSYDGKLINDVTPTGYDAKMKPCFFTLFPQKGKTYCLVSYLHRHRKDYNFLKELINKSEEEKGIIISNILINYVENFVVKPSYWNENMKDKFSVELFFRLVHDDFISDDALNFFSRRSRPAVDNQARHHLLGVGRGQPQR